MSITKEEATELVTEAFKPRNWMRNKTPEELEAIYERSRRTRAANIAKREEDGRRYHEQAAVRIEEIRQGIYDLERRRDEVTKEIAALEQQYRDLKRFVPLVTHAGLTPKNFLLMRQDIIEAAKPLGQTSGVYFLVQDEEVVYVGQSKSVMQRIEKHRSSKEFDSYAWIACGPENLDALETLYIHILKPKLNRSKGLMAIEDVRFT